MNNGEGSVKDRLWSAYSTELEEFKKEFDETEIDETEFLHNFLNDYLIFSSTQIRVITAIMNSFLVPFEDVEEALSQSNDVSTLSYILCEYYLFKRSVQEEKRKEMDLMIKKIDRERKMKRANYRYADFVDEDDIEP